MATMVFSFIVLLCVHDVLTCHSDISRSRRSAKLPEQMLSDLHRDLMTDYDPDVIPMLGSSTGDATNALGLNLGVSLISLAMDGRTGLLTSTVWLKMSWMDFRLKWEPAMYGGVQVVRFPPRKIWTPDFEVQYLILSIFVHVYFYQPVTALTSPLTVL
jgi:hypothetical protein